MVYMVSQNPGSDQQQAFSDLSSCSLGLTNSPRFFFQTLPIPKTQDLALPKPQIGWIPPPPSFLKVNFDDVVFRETYEAIKNQNGELDGRSLRGDLGLQEQGIRRIVKRERERERERERDNQIWKYYSMNQSITNPLYLIQQVPN